MNVRSSKFARMFACSMLALVAPFVSLGQELVSTPANTPTTNTPTTSARTGDTPASGALLGAPPTQSTLDGQTGQTLLRTAAEVTAAHRTIEARMRVRTDLLGQPLIGSGRYAQLQSSAGLLLRLELAIQAGEQATSVKQVSDGRDLYEHWRIAGNEQVNHVDLRRVADAIRRSASAGLTSSTSTSLATGGLPKLLQQLNENFDFTKADVRTGKIGVVPVFFATGVWRAEKLAVAAPQAVQDDAIHFEKLPAHLPHQVEVLIGQRDYFPYRVTYQRWQPDDGKHVLKPAVTTEFFEVAIDEPLDPTQFNFQQPKINMTDRTNAFLQSLGLTPDGMATKPRPVGSR